MEDDLRKRFAAQLAQPPRPPLERARDFLMFHIHNYDDESLALEARAGDASVVDGLCALEEILSKEQEPGIIYRMVAYEGNRLLAEETDEAAIEWLRVLVLQLRDWLGEYAPPAPQK
jgi:hypothetical protein